MVSVSTVSPQGTAPAAGTDLSALPHERPVGGDVQGAEPLSPPSSPDVSRPEPEETDWVTQAFLARRGVVLAPDQSIEAAFPAGDKGVENGTGTGNVNPVPTSAGGQAPGGAPAGLPTTDQPKTDSSGNVTYTLTQEEIDRRVQSETDRRIARANKDARARADQEEEQRLLAEDPLGFVQHTRNKLKNQEDSRKLMETSQELAVSTMRAYDASVLDPLINRLPDAEVKRLTTEIDASGIPGREKLAAAAMKSLEDHWKAQGVASARDTLLNDPGFIKEIFTRYNGGGRIPEVEHVPADGPSGAPVSEDSVMDNLIRSAGRQMLRR